MQKTNAVNRMSVKRMRNLLYCRDGAGLRSGATHIDEDEVAHSVADIDGAPS